MVADGDVDRVEDVVGVRMLRDAMRQPDPDTAGRLRLTLRFDWMDEAEAAIFRLGQLVEVIEPAELREQLLRLGRAVLGRYGARADRPESNQGAPI